METAYAEKAPSRESDPKGNVAHTLDQRRRIALAEVDNAQFS